MKHIIIRNFGPLKEADMDLSDINLIIGQQGTGKSCAMMVACFCSWVEKRIMLRQSAKEFEEGSAFLGMITSYYHAKGYIHPDTHISYESKFMTFSYDNATMCFSQSWKARNRWKYCRPKVSYIPAERNILALVSNWNKIEMDYDSIMDFYADWDVARRYMRNERNILQTGISYEYDAATRTDSIITSKGKKLEMVNGSSGMQSLIPQFVHMDYLLRGIYEAEEQEVREKSFSEKEMVNNLLDILYQRNYKRTGDSGKNKKVVHIEGKDFLFHSVDGALKFQKEVASMLRTDHAEIFLEEPESNLFPPTQCQLMNWIVDMQHCQGHQNFFFIATHSPYVLNHLLQENLKQFKLFLTYSSPDGECIVKTADEKTLQDIYDNGSDAFFNFEAFLD